MLKQLKYNSGLLIVAACVCCAEAAPNPERGERILARQPVAVQNAIRAQLGGGRLRTIDKEENGGDVTYDVEIVRNGKTRNFTVGGEGELLDAEVFMDELPATVQQAIKNKVGNATLGEIDKSFDDGQISYDVEMINGGKSRTFTLDASGKLTDEEILLSELPQSFQQAIKKEAGDGTPDEITRTFEGDGTLYDVDVSKNGKTRTLTFDSSGALLSTQEEIALAEISGPAKTRIQALANSGNSWPSASTPCPLKPAACISFPASAARNLWTFTAMKFNGKAAAAARPAIKSITSPSGISKPVACKRSKTAAPPG